MDDLFATHDALAETRDLARKASVAATAALEGVEGDKSTKRLLLDIPEILLARSN